MPARGEHREREQKRGRLAADEQEPPARHRAARSAARSSSTGACTLKPTTPP